MRQVTDQTGWLCRITKMLMGRFADKVSDQLNVTAAAFVEDLGETGNPVRDEVKR